MNPLSARYAGVTIPEHQVRTATMSDKPMGTVVQLVEMRVCGVGIVDETGRVVSTVAYKVGGQWFTDPEGETWTRNLMRAGTKLHKNLDVALEDYEESKDKHIPDAVAKKVSVTTSKLIEKTQQTQEGSA